MNLTEIAERAYQNSKAHGFWDPAKGQDDIALKLELMHTELAEAFEEVRMKPADRCGELHEFVYETKRGRFKTLANGCGEQILAEDLRPIRCTNEDRHEQHEGPGKPAGFLIELADAQIRIADTVGRLEGRILHIPAFNSSSNTIHDGLLRTHREICLAHAGCDPVVPEQIIVPLSRAFWRIDRIAANVLTAAEVPISGEQLGWALHDACELKMNYNATRPMMHGKAC